MKNSLLFFIFLIAFGNAAAEEINSLIVPRLNTPEGVVTIPAGWFQMGSSSKENKGGYTTEQPLHRVFLSTYQIDRYEVSNIQYFHFINKTHYKPPVYWKGSIFSSEIANHPVAGVSWFDAIEFCHMEGKRLPTEAEWEKAARGETEINYPWGNQTASPALANFGKQVRNSNLPIELIRDKFYPPLVNVNGFFEGKSPYGVYQMGGNVMEWVADWWDPEYYLQSPDHNPSGPLKGEHKVIRGGSWNDDPLALRTATRTGIDPHSKTFTIGFRCAKSL
jgi:iron(II)-dependent oxidoreductase